MKIVFFLQVLLGSISFAKGADTTAHYIVPTPAELVEHSRFEVEIVKSYAGSSSTEISYVFPKELTGDPGLLVQFKKITGNEDTGVSFWEAEQMTAACTDDGERVQCNVYLKKTPVGRAQALFQFPLVQQDFRSSVPLFDSSKAKDFLVNSGLPKQILDAKLNVLDKFLSSEPAGILSYEY